MLFEFLTLSHCLTTLFSDAVLFGNISMPDDIATYDFQIRSENLMSLQFLMLQCVMLKLVRLPQSLVL